MKYILTRCGGVRGALYGMVEGLALIGFVLVMYFAGVALR